MNKSTIKVLNKAIKETNGNEFKVLYYILNGKALGVEKFYKDVLAGELNIKPRQIALITDSLVKKGYITKERNNKGSIYYFKLQTEKRETLEKALTRKEQYHQQLENPMWEKKRNIILKRDQYQCQLCGSKHNLQVHHIKYSSDKKAWEYPNLDLITLCEECHKKVHADHQHELNPYKKNN
jgi:DNA-binding MarR family transcriptional regulator